MYLEGIGRKTADGLMVGYKVVLSPILHSLSGPGSGCRYEPSCSVYAHEAVRVNGWWVGMRMGLKRVFRCHPWGGAGYDPVPRLDHERC